MEKKCINIMTGIIIGLIVGYTALSAWLFSEPPVYEIVETVPIEPTPAPTPTPVVIVVEVVREVPVIEQQDVEEVVEDVDMLVLTDEELDLLAHCVEAEAGNQDLYGKQLVVDVILNRMDSDNFPDTIEGVILQKNAFSVVSSGYIDMVTPRESTYKAIALECESRSNDQVVYFMAGKFSRYGTPWEKVGDHYFSYE